ncbi:uncharacterized protein MKK02DRAFT_30452 [Dioszegia hungarica]|uniref:Uncharacterized protein n=1 Tax=Dioszegia hungarica TaxID=4972 RepID=A0AA38H1A2_9TREE|nr:uncharacterized protein MKK02DRAFT_30452 [Dioszegia hungarica]KAI9632702.1 hypothetical protein MKK02DRAFT_30452 [Dioszegia hungarica]
MSSSAAPTASVPDGFASMEEWREALTRPCVDAWGNPRAANCRTTRTVPIEIMMLGDTSISTKNWWVDDICHPMNGMYRTFTQPGVSGTFDEKKNLWFTLPEPAGGERGLYIYSPPDGKEDDSKESFAVYMTPEQFEETRGNDPGSRSVLVGPVLSYVITENGKHRLSTEVFKEHDGDKKGYQKPDIPRKTWRGGWISADGSRLKSNGGERQDSYRHEERSVSSKRPDVNAFGEDSIGPDGLQTYSMMDGRPRVARAIGDRQEYIGRPTARGRIPSVTDRPTSDPMVRLPYPIARVTMRLRVVLVVTGVTLDYIKRSNSSQIHPHTAVVHISSPNSNTTERLRIKNGAGAALGPSDRNRPCRPV